MTTKKCVLLSIHPEFADAILNGKKNFEFRRVLFRQPVREVYIYATAPVSRVVGKFEVDLVHSATPAEVWNLTKDLGGVSRELFFAYFAGRSVAHAIKVRNPVRFSRPKQLSYYLLSGVPPQSFCYI